MAVRGWPRPFILLQSMPTRPIGLALTARGMRHSLAGDLGRFLQYVEKYGEWCDTSHWEARYIGTLDTALHLGLVEEFETDEDI